MLYALVSGNNGSRPGGAGRRTAGDKAAGAIHPLGKAVLSLFGQGDNKQLATFSRDATAGTIDAPSKAGQDTINEANRGLRSVDPTRAWR